MNTMTRSLIAILLLALALEDAHSYPFFSLHRPMHKRITVGINTQCATLKGNSWLDLPVEDPCKKFTWPCIAGRCNTTVRVPPCGVPTGQTLSYPIPRSSCMTITKAHFSPGQSVDVLAPRSHGNININNQRTLLEHVLGHSALDRPLLNVTIDDGCYLPVLVIHAISNHNC